MARLPACILTLPTNFDAGPRTSTGNTAATAFKIRNDCDYNDCYVAAQEDAKMQHENADKFIKRIEQYLKSCNISL